MIPDSILPPVRPRTNYTEISQDSLVYAVLLNPAQMPDPVDNAPNVVPMQSDVMQEKIDRLRPRKRKSL